MTKGIYRHKEEAKIGEHLTAQFAKTDVTPQKIATSGSTEREMAMVEQARQKGHRDPEVVAHIQMMLG